MGGKHPNPKDKAATPAVNTTKQEAMLWHSVMEKSMKDAAAIQRHVMNEVMKNREQKEIDPVAVANDKVNEVNETNAKQNIAMLSRIYDEYDKNRDGSLDETEIRRLVRASLHEQKKFAPQLVTSILLCTVEQSICMLTAMGMTKEETDAVKGQMLTALEKCIQSSIADMQRAMDEMIDRSDDLAHRLYREMDINRDGKVSKDEFLLTYSQAANKMVNLAELLGQTQQYLLDPNSAVAPSA